MKAAVGSLASDAGLQCRPAVAGAPDREATTQAWSDRPPNHLSCVLHSQCPRVGTASQSSWQHPKVPRCVGPSMGSAVAPSSVAHSKSVCASSASLSSRGPRRHMLMSPPATSSVPGGLRRLTSASTCPRPPGGRYVQQHVTRPPPPRSSHSASMQYPSTSTCCEITRYLAGTRMATPPQSPPLALTCAAEAQTSAIGKQPPHVAPAAGVQCVS